MAVFQKIRDKSLLSLIVIGGGLVLFILGDYLNSSAPTIDDSVGNFEGKDISQREYDNYFSTILYLSGNGNTRSSLSDQEKQQYAMQTWNQLVMEKIFESEAESNGIGVTDNEVDDMLGGSNPYPFYVGRIFGGQQNYQSIYPKLKDDVDNFEKFAQVGPQEANLIKDFGVSLRKQEKLMSLVKNSFFTTSSESLDLYKGKFSTKNVTVGTVPYYLVADSLIDVEESEIKEFYNKNKGKYKLLYPSKKVVYGAYRVNPTSEDDQEVLNWAQETVKLFTEEENDERFVRTESEAPFDAAYYKKGGGLVNELDNALFDKEAGFVYGPYTGYNKGDKTYNVAKIIDVQYMPDSAKVSQILLTPDKSIEALLKATNNEPDQKAVAAMWESFDAYVDSLHKELNAGLSFANTASAVSVDSVSALKGGDLGWIQEKSPAYAPKFLDSVFHESSSKDKVKKVQVYTQNGQFYYYQLVKVDEMGEKSKKMKVGIVTKTVLPGKKTRDSFFNRINQVAIALNEGQTLKELKDTFQFEIDSAKVEPAQYLVNDLKGARGLVHWAFNLNDEKESRVFDFDRKYIVALVAEETDKGYKTLKDEEVKGEIREKVRKIKKAAYIAEKLGDVNAGTLDNLSSAFAGATVETVDKVTLSEGIQKLGYESNLTGVISSLDSDEVSSVVGGLDAAYIVKVNSENLAKVTDDTNFELEANLLNQKNGNKVDFVLQELIVEKADLEDKRTALQ